MGSRRGHSDATVALRSRSRMVTGFGNALIAEGPPSVLFLLLRLLLSSRRQLVWIATLGHLSSFFLQKTRSSWRLTAGMYTSLPYVEGDDE